MIVQKSRRMPRVLVVDYRDRVYERLAADFAHAGFQVIRSYCAAEGIIQYLLMRPDLVVASVDLPDQSGWLLTAKLNLTEPQPRIWLYKSNKSPGDLAKAGFLGAEELLAYRDLQELSDSVAACLAGEAVANHGDSGRGRSSYRAASGSLGKDQFIGGDH